MWPKNMWKSIPHLMQQHETPRKGHSTYNLQELIKSKTQIKSKNHKKTLRLTDLE